MGDSNFRIDVVGQGPSLLRHALSIVWEANYLNGQRTGVTHFAIRPAEPANAVSGRSGTERPGKPLRLILFRCIPSPIAPDLIALPVVMDLDHAFNFARKWLTPDPEPGVMDFSGPDVGGFRLYDEGKDHVDGDPQAIVAVTPDWLPYR